MSNTKHTPGPWGNYSDEALAETRRYHLARCTQANMDGVPAPEYDFRRYNEICDEQNRRAALAKVRP